MTYNTAELELPTDTFWILPMHISITVPLVTSLVAQQFPQYAHFPIEAVLPGGVDHRTFRLGDTLLLRLPSAKGYATQVKKEQQWLPHLAQHLSTPIPTPVAMGMPNEAYPYHWSIYQWIEGQSADAIDAKGVCWQLVAAELAQFLRTLHTTDPTGGPPGGLHNYHRGTHPSVYDHATRTYIHQLSGAINTKRALVVWERAMRSQWQQSAVWVHGDLASGNILIKKGQLAAVIDFGCMGIGDPACDLTIAWTLLRGEARQIFKDRVDLDPDTWARARGWALWKAGFEWVALDNKNTPVAQKQLQILGDILSEDARS